MGRPKNYERVELLDRAIELFWLQGYSETTAAQLAETLGVNRKSMYAEFGSKQGLFEAALERYSTHHLSHVLRRLEADDAGADAIRSAFAGYARANEGRIRGLGCLLCNTAVERAALDPGAAKHVDAYLARVRAAFRNALEKAQKAAEITDTADLDELASYFMMALIGVAACVRAKAPVDQVWASTRVATGLLDSLAP